MERMIEGMNDFFSQAGPLLREERRIPSSIQPARVGVTFAGLIGDLGTSSRDSAGGFQGVPGEGLVESRRLLMRKWRAKPRLDIAGDGRFDEQDDSIHL